MKKSSFEIFNAILTIASIDIPNRKPSKSHGDIYNLADGIELMEKVRWKIECINHHTDINETGHSNMLQQTKEIAKSIMKLAKSIEQNPSDPQFQEKIDILREAIEISTSYKAVALQHVNGLERFDENKAALRKIMSALDDDYQSQVSVSENYTKIEKRLRELTEKLTTFKLDES